MGVPIWSTVVGNCCEEVLAKSLVVMGFSGMVVGLSRIGLVTATG